MASSPLWKALPLDPAGFNKKAQIPFGCTTGHVKAAMEEFLDFLTFLNKQLASKKLPRMEDFLMQANFSSMVGEFMSATLPKHSKGITKNRWHNGHPDLVPVGKYPKDSILHGDVGIEIKGSRHARGWQGHNAEDAWLMVFVFDSSTPVDESKGIPARPFRFTHVYGAQLVKSDWTFSGRSETSRRTITASVNESGFQKMVANWIYRDPSIPPPKPSRRRKA